MKYNKEKFLRFIETDLLLKNVWKDRQKTPVDQHDSQLQAMFNGYVLDDMDMEQAYLEFEAKYNMFHEGVLERGENWFRFKGLTPNTLDEILPESVFINRITREEGDNVWYVEFSNGISS